MRREGLGPKSKNITTTPLLVVEVLSPITRRIDTASKLLAYRDAGVPWYWIVDPDVPSLTVWRLEGADYVEAGNAEGEQTYTSDAPFSVAVTPARLLDDLTG